MTSDTDHSTEIAVAIEADGWTSTLSDPAALVARAARAAFAGACPGAPAATISLLLTDDQTVQAINKTWRGLDYPTNVLSFPATRTRAGTNPQPEFEGVPLELGDVALGFETCAREAAAADRPLGHHVEHLVVHGVLHLLGWDHGEEAEADRMEELETRILAGLGLPDPYAPERLDDG
jgi:probable rRNA maturation factor